MDKEVLENLRIAFYEAWESIKKALREVWEFLKDKKRLEKPNRNYVIPLNTTKRHQVTNRKPVMARVRSNL